MTDHHDQRIGTFVGRYKLTERMCAGRLGNIYRAEHPSILSKVLIKVIPSDRLPSGKGVHRFWEAVGLVNRLGHRSLVTIRDCGNEADGSLYLVMDHPSDETLERALARGGPVGPEVAAQLLADLGGALAAMHKIDVLHRGLSPTAIVLVDDPEQARAGRWVLLDPGVDCLLPRSGVGEGADDPLWRAPEELMIGPVGKAADAYTLAALAYHALTGKNPRDLDTTRPGGGHGQPLKQLCSQLPDSLERAVMNALSDDPEERISVAALAHRAGAIIEPLPSAAVTQPLPDPPADGQEGLDLVMDPVATMITAVSAEESWASLVFDPSEAGAQQDPSSVTADADPTCSPKPAPEKARAVGVRYRTAPGRLTYLLGRDVDQPPDDAWTWAGLDLTVDPVTLRKTWQRCGIIADFVADCLSCDTVEASVAEEQRSTVAMALNELLENAVKCSDGVADPLRIAVAQRPLGDGGSEVTLCVINRLSTAAHDAFRDYLDDLCRRRDLDQYCLDRMARADFDPERSQMGLLMLLRDYPVTLRVDLVAEEQADPLAMVRAACLLA